MGRNVVLLFSALRGEINMAALTEGQLRWHVAVEIHSEWVLGPAVRAMWSRLSTPTPTYIGPRNWFCVSVVWGSSRPSPPCRLTRYSKSCRPGRPAMTPRRPSWGHVKVLGPNSWTYFSPVYSLAEGMSKIWDQIPEHIFHPCTH